ncbi:hypothetical protein EV195_10841 [Tenacibaculum skagerrakense]|uniref:Uncharacterized protein n=1 Tax=Tenacibaculum skagerrakense TaxID=186571 RepID=A0A4R2NPI8_9FLAO|nr:hypothetical protein [Tenacibaculum skagerrakense]TCP23572.1 hypothetical protein EV195_10841 [Tenacibaculum skagerrakense]
MLAEIDTIKEEIYDIVAEIDDENVLQAIKTIITNIHSKTIDQVTDKRDLTGYIKEWVKNM